MRIYLLALSFSVIALHFCDQLSTPRNLIQYDDEQLVKPIVEMSVSRYVQEWLPNRDNHAYPLRDATYFADAQASRLLGFNTYWLTQILMFLAIIYFSYRLFSWVWPQQARWIAGLTTMVALHPTCIEVVQWITCRKHLMVVLILLPATTYVFKTLDTRYTMKQWLGIGTVYVAALLCFPSGILWLPWVLAIKRRQFTAVWQKSALAAAVIMTLIVCWYLITGGNNEYAIALTHLLSLHSLKNALLYFELSLGRGFFNLLAPFWLAVYYRESHPANFVGMVLLVVLIVAVWRARHALARIDPKKWQLFTLNAGLVVALLLPSAVVFGSFGDFVWADRYDFIILPFALLALALLVQLMIAWVQQNKAHAKISSLAYVSLFSLLLTWTAGALLVTLHRVPLWRDTTALMTDCARSEKSPKCILRAVQFAVHGKQGCGAVQAELEEARDIFLEAQPSTSYEFFYSMPFYDAACLAIIRDMPVARKLQLLKALSEVYNNAGELSFSGVLILLQAGDVEAAYAIAKDNYLTNSAQVKIRGDDLTDIFRGQAQALCDILNTSHVPNDCEERLKVFERYAPPLSRLNLQDWGNEITHVLYGEYTSNSFR